MIVTYRKMNGSTMTMDGVTEIEIIINEAGESQVFRMRGLTRGLAPGDVDEVVMLNVSAGNGILLITPRTIDSIDLTEKRYAKTT